MCIKITYEKKTKNLGKKGKRPQKKFQKEATRMVMRHKNLISNQGDAN